MPSHKDTSFRAQHPYSPLILSWFKARFIKQTPCGTLQSSCKRASSVYRLSFSLFCLLSAFIMHLFVVYRIDRSALIRRVSHTSERVYTVLRTHSAENKLIVSPDNSWGMEFRRLPGTQRSIRGRTNLSRSRLVHLASRNF